jgi:DNA-binding transcriptional MerR regulator
VASSAGISVRTLRHYDAIGLLVPSARTEAGYRLYTAADVERLYRILALRSLGLRLDAIGGQLGTGAELAEVLRRQLEAVDARIAADTDMRTRLERLLAACAAGAEPTLDQLTDTMEAMRMTDRYFTEEQQRDLARRRETLGPEGMRSAERAWTDLIAAAEAERAAGTDPASPRMQAIAARWRDLIEQFTGGDPGIRDSLARMYREEGVENASRSAVSADLMAYVGRAMEAGRT